VINATTKPELYIINNPADHLKPEDKVEGVRYIVPFEEIKGKAD
jgi:hypothetical protein